MAEAYEGSSAYDTTERQSLVGVTVTGLVVGALAWLLNLGIQRYFIEPVFCRNADSFSLCSNGGTIAWAVAAIILTVVGLFALVRIGVYRPLLVVLAAFAALWSANSWLGPLPWWQATLWHGALFALAYLLFTWIARVDRFPVAFIATIVLILLLRLVVVNA